MNIPKNVGDIIATPMYRIEKLKEDVYHIEDKINNPSSMYCVIGSKRVLWVDAANEHKDHVDELRDIANTLAQGKEIIVAITHDHYDHVGQLVAFNDCEILFPLKDKRVEDYHYIEDGYLIDLGDKKVKAVEVPGHTPGSMVYLVDQDELIITGDAIGSSFVWLFFMEDVLTYYKKGIHHLYDQVKTYQSPLFMCGHRWQQFASTHRDPLSPINDPMTMQYLLDMMTLVEHIENKTALTRPFESLGKPQEHCVYSFEGSQAEIDSFVSLIK